MLLVLAALFLATRLTAQQPPFARERPDIGLSAGFTSVAGSSALLLGAHARLQLDQALTVGVAAHGTSMRGVARQLTYGGVTVGVTSPAVGKMRLGLQLLGGGGAVATGGANRVLERAGLLVWQPGAAVEVEATPLVRVALDLDWRFIAGGNTRGVTGAALSGRVVALRITVRGTGASRT